MGLAKVFKPVSAAPMDDRNQTSPKHPSVPPRPRRAHRSPRVLDAVAGSSATAQNSIQKLRGTERKQSEGPLLEGLTPEAAMGTPAGTPGAK